MVQSMRICFGPVGWLHRPELFPEDLPPDWRTAYLANEACTALLPWADWGGEAAALESVAWEDLPADFELWLEWSAEGWEWLQAGGALPPGLRQRARGWALWEGPPPVAEAFGLPVCRIARLDAEPGSVPVGGQFLVSIPAGASLRQQAAWLRPWLTARARSSQDGGVGVVLLRGERIPSGRLQELAELPALFAGG